MQWGQIKTIFILTFLVLDVFLFIQFYERQKQADIPFLESRDSPIEDKLANDNIKIPEELPTAQEKEPFISVSQKMFTEEDLNQVAKKADLDIRVINQTFILSKLHEPLKLSDEASEEEILNAVTPMMLYPDQYEYWDWNKDLNILVFFQKKQERPIYFNQSGLVLFFLNDENEIVFFTQTMLGDERSRQDKKSLIQPMIAIETLYNTNELRFGEEITKVEIGFHSRVPLADGVQVFVPAWKITVNDERNYFVNAIEGFVFSSHENEFLEDIMTHDLERIKEHLPESDLRDFVVTFITEKLAATNRGGQS